MAYRLEGVASEGAFPDRHAVDVLRAALRRAAHFRKGRSEGELRRVGPRVERRRKLGPDAAAQRRVCFFIDISDAGGARFVYKFADGFVGLNVRQVARLGIYDDDRIVRARREHAVRAYRDARFRAFARELYACVERACEIVGDHEQLRHLTPLLSDKLRVCPRASCPSCCCRAGGALRRPLRRGSPCRRASRRIRRDRSVSP